MAKKIEGNQERAKPSMVEYESSLAKPTRGDSMEHIAEPSKGEQREHLAETSRGNQRQRRTLKAENFEEVNPSSCPQSIYKPPFSFPQVLKRILLIIIFLSFLLSSSNCILTSH